jgi:AcrR family transcriptional regulator
MADDATIEKRGPGRPRSEATRRAIFDAALDLLHSEPYRDISIDRIAARAKVGKQSIYRWWSSKAELILEAYIERATASVPPVEPSPDSLADLEATLKRLCAVVSQPGVRKVFRVKFHDIFVARRHDVFGHILKVGMERGQLRADVAIDDVLDVTLGSIWFRLLSGTSRPLDDAYAEMLVDLLRARLARSPDDAMPPVRRPDAIVEA